MTDSEQRIRVLLADDHRLVRDGLKRLINDEPDMSVIAEASDGREALRLTQELEPDIALVDVSMPGWDGVTLAREMRRTCPLLKIVAVTRHDNGGFVRKMMSAGACGYVLKQNATRILVGAVRVCVAGEVFIDPSVRTPPSAAEASAATIPNVSHQGEPLTALENEVLQMTGALLSMHAIAQQLGITLEEVQDVKSVAMRKAGLITRLEVIKYAQSRPPNGIKED